MASPVKYFLSVIAGLDLAIEERDVRHKAEHDDYLLVIPRLDRGIQEIPGSRYACPRMTEEKYCHSCTLLLSSVIPVLGTGICKGDIRV
mgnify:FL=1